MAEPSTHAVRSAQADLHQGFQSQRGQGSGHWVRGNSAHRLQFRRDAVCAFRRPVASRPRPVGWHFCTGRRRDRTRGSVISGDRAGDRRRPRNSSAAHGNPGHPVRQQHSSRGRTVRRNRRCGVPRRLPARLHVRAWDEDPHRFRMGPDRDGASDADGRDDCLTAARCEDGCVGVGSV